MTRVDRSLFPLLYAANSYILVNFARWAANSTGNSGPKDRYRSLNNRWALSGKGIEFTGGNEERSLKTVLKRLRRRGTTWNKSTDRRILEDIFSKLRGGLFKLQNGINNFCSFKKEKRKRLFISNWLTNSIFTHWMKIRIDWEERNYLSREKGCWSKECMKVRMVAKLF